MESRNHNEMNALKIYILPVPLCFGVMIFTGYLRVEGKILLHQAEFLKAHIQLLPLL